MIGSPRRACHIQRLLSLLPRGKVTLNKFLTSDLLFYIKTPFFRILFSNLSLATVITILSFSFFKLSSTQGWIFKINTFVVVEHLNQDFLDTVLVSTSVEHVDCIFRVNFLKRFLRYLLLLGTRAHLGIYQIDLTRIIIGRLIRT